MVFLDQLTCRGISIRRYYARAPFHSAHGLFKGWPAWRVATNIENGLDRCCSQYCGRYTPCGWSTMGWELATVEGCWRHRRALLVPIPPHSRLLILTSLDFGHQCHLLRFAHCLGGIPWSRTYHASVNSIQICVHLCHHHQCVPQSLWNAPLHLCMFISLPALIPFESHTLHLHRRFPAHSTFLFTNKLPKGHPPSNLESDYSRSSCPWSSLGLLLDS